MKKFKISVLIIAVLLMGLFNTHSDAAISNSKTSGQQTISDGIYIIRSKINNKYVLDVNGASIYNGANVQLYEYTDVPQKKYKVTYLGDGTYSIIATHSNKAIDVKDASKSKGANVQQWEWNETDAQRWIIKDVGNGYYSIISKCNGLYVDVLDAKAQNYQNIQMCDGNGLDAQKFKFEKIGENTSTPTVPSGPVGTQSVEDGKYIIRSAINSNYVLDVENASTANGANIQLYQYNGTAAQQFNIQYLGDGLYKILASHSNKSMDVKDASKNIGANVQQCEQNKEDAQKWIIQKNNDGTYSIISRCNGLYVDVYNAVAANGTNIQMCNSNGLNAQKFKLEKVAENPGTPSIPEGTQSVEDGKYIIRSAINSNYVLDVANASTANGANIQLYQYNGTAAQQFNIQYLGDGLYKILASHSNKSMDVKDASKNIGANVQQCEQNKEDAQKWIIQKNNDGTYSIISKCNGLYVDVYNAVAANGTNIQMCDGNGLNAQKFKLEKVKDNNPEEPVGKKTIEDGQYAIKSALNSNYALDVANKSTANGANVQLYKYNGSKNQQFNVSYLGNGYYKIIAVHSNKSIDVKDASQVKGANVQQYQSNNSKEQQWVITDNKDGTYSIISRCNGLYVDVYNASVANGTNIQMCDGNGLNAQKFKFEKVETAINIDTTKYPGYKERIEKLMKEHPSWNFQLLYTGLKFSDAVSGEFSVRKRNLVPTSYSGEWIAGTELYDTGWYAASEKAIAYYMDPRNFIDETNIFQFQDVNEYISDICTLDSIKTNVNGSFLEDYATDINTACKNTNVNPYYIIARLFQENGRNPSNGTAKMNGGDGKYYYNPFNIGATGDSTSEVYNNALATAKSKGWDTMVKALEGGIYFCKDNWLENYQNTLYQNRFDIDTRNGTSLYTHQYMQNLMGAYSEANTLRGIYSSIGALESSFTFIIPVYEGMDAELSPMPSKDSETYAMNVKTTGTKINIRKEANTNSEILKVIEEKGTVLLSIQRGINSNWQKVITSDGIIGYISGDYVTQIDDVTTCNYKARVKTNDGNGCNVRVGPSTRLDKVTALSDGTEVTVIDDSTYKNIDGYDWSRVRLSNGTQVFLPSKYLAK